MFEVFRQILPEGGSHKGTSPCSISSCTRTTREGKPFCSDHIENAPYVREILETLSQRDSEEAALGKKRGKISNTGFFYTETLLLLRSRDYTAKGLSRRLDISHQAAERLICLMAKDGLVLRDQTSRGDTTISGLGDRDLAGETE